VSKGARIFVIIAILAGLIATGAVLVADSMRQSAYREMISGDEFHFLVIDPNGDPIPEAVIHERGWRPGGLLSGPVGGPEFQSQYHVNRQGLASARPGRGYAVEYWATAEGCTLGSGPGGGFSYYTAILGPHRDFRNPARIVLWPQDELRPAYRRANDGVPGFGDIDRSPRGSQPWTPSTFYDPGMWWGICFPDDVTVDSEEWHIRLLSDEEALGPDCFFAFRCDTESHVLRYKYSESIDIRSRWTFRTGGEMWIGLEMSTWKGLHGPPPWKGVEQFEIDYRDQDLIYSLGWPRGGGGKFRGLIQFRNIIARISRTYEEHEIVYAFDGPIDFRCVSTEHGWRVKVDPVRNDWLPSERGADNGESIAEPYVPSAPVDKSIGE
jgi:hypothetical protein